jgi:hypothetical protein
MDFGKYRKQEQAELNNRIPEGFLPCLHISQEIFGIFHLSYEAVSTDLKKIMAHICFQENNGTYCRHFWGAFWRFYAFKSPKDKKIGIKK